MKCERGRNYVDDDEQLAVEFAVKITSMVVMRMDEDEKLWKNMMRIVFVLWWTFKTVVASEDKKKMTQKLLIDIKMKFIKEKKIE